MLLLGLLAPGHVLLSKPPHDADSEVLDVYNAALETFRTSTDASGRSFHVTTIQEPSLDDTHTEDALCTSYVNYLIVRRFRGSSGDNPLYPVV